MTSAIQALSVTPSSGSSNSATTTSTSNSIDENTFLKLLVAQLQYQDPSNPTDPTQFISQTAEFQQVQQLSSMETAINNLATETTATLNNQEASTAAAMLGQQVSATMSDGSTVSGVVSGVQFTQTGPVLTVGSSSVPLSDIDSMTRPTTS